VFGWLCLAGWLGEPLADGSWGNPLGWGAFTASLRHSVRTLLGKPS
jgi:hypothetical protein